MSSIKREDVVGKHVVDPEGKIVGTVKDVVIGSDGHANLLVSIKVRRGSKVRELEYTIPFSKVVSVGDVVLISAKVRVRKV